MKINIILFTFLGFFGSLSAYEFDYEEPMALCLGDIVFNFDIDPDLCLYYKGNKLKLDINHDKKTKKLGCMHPKKQLMRTVPYTLNEPKATQKFHLLICSHPYFASDSNTITYLHVPKKASYKFYILSGARKYNKDNEVDGCFWTVTQERLLGDRIVPDNTIIFLFNADYVEGLEIKSWPLNSNIRLLPSIIIDKMISEEDIIRAIVQARMTAMDFDTIHHRHPKSPTKIESKTLVTIKQ